MTAPLTALHPSRLAPLGALLVLVLASTGCYSPPELRDRADRDALALVDQRRAELFGDTGPFSLPAATASFGRAARPESEWTTRERVLSGLLDRVGPLNVVGALKIASEDSQEVQEERESLYLAALDLTQDRWSFGYRYDASGSGDLAGQIDGEATSLNAGFGAGVTRILGTGAVILADVGTNLFRFVSTGDGLDAVSNIGLSVTQPLLRGTGRLITLEPLRQSERNLIYSVRAYERFRRTYAVDVASRVYRVLQAYDRLNNEQLNFNNLELLTDRNEALAEAGQQTEIQADQARQQELGSKNQLVVLQGDLEFTTDSFKVFLGLPVSVGLEFEPGLLGTLASDNSFLSGLDEDVAVEFAIEHRLDVMTAFDQVQDATRREAIARDALRVGLGVSGALDSSTPGSKPLGFRLGEVDWSAGVDLDLPVDLLPARNAWRSAEIALVDSKRTYARFLDNVTVNVRSALRNARNSYDSFEIQQNAVQLAIRRVEGSQLSLSAGLATTRDVLESQADLRQARDAATSARISFTLSLLDLWLELEILRVDETGIYYDEQLSAELHSRLAQ